MTPSRVRIIPFLHGKITLFPWALACLMAMTEAALLRQLSCPFLPTRLDQAGRVCRRTYLKEE
jgi:hypothetical protein